MLFQIDLARTLNSKLVFASSSSIIPLHFLTLSATYTLIHRHQLRHCILVCIFHCLRDCSIQFNATLLLLFVAILHPICIICFFQLVSLLCIISFVYFSSSSTLFCIIWFHCYWFIFFLMIIIHEDSQFFFFFNP